MSNKLTLNEIYDLQENQETVNNENMGSRYEPVTEGSVGSRALQNAPASAVQFVKDVFEPIMNPIQTAKSIGELSSSVVSLMKDGEQGNEDIAREVGKFFANRYGSLDKIKETFANDPVGIMGDLSLVLSGGGLVARGAAKGSQVANAFTAAAKYTDPTRAVTYVPGKAINAVGGAVRGLAGVATGAGGEAIKIAGQGGADFTKAMRGQTSQYDIVEIAKNSVDQLKEIRKQDYLNTSKNWNLDKIDIKDADATEVANLANKYRIQNTEKISGRGIAKNSDMDKFLIQADELFKGYDTDATPGLRSVAGLDAIRLELDSIKPANYSGRDFQIFSAMRNDLSKIIKNQDGMKDYVKGMDDYSFATIELDEIMKGLSLGDKASAITSFNKLKNILKGQGTISKELFDKLPNAKALEELIAGYNLSAGLPPGLARSLTAGGIGYLSGGAGAGAIAGAAGGLALVSPRFVGETARTIGNINRIGAPIGRGIKTGLLAGRPIGTLQNQNLLQ
tara:strand:+ start:1646 stop:3166 length:1521 start_codon:yes stop_codon:yes gene_type:complete